MKRKFFLINILLFFLAPSLISTFSSIPKINLHENNAEIAAINVATENYLNLSYQNGIFYSWDQTDSDEQHSIGIFSIDGQSYLLDNFGVFWSLDYQITKFYRVSDQRGIARIKYYQDENQKEYTDGNFIVELNNNKMTFVSTTPLATENNDFVVLSDTSVVSYGVGLDFIDMSNQSVTNLIPPYENGKFPTSFTKINADSGIFVDGDQYFYLLKNITSSAIGSKEKINLQAPFSNATNVVTINDSNVVLRSSNNGLYFLDTNDVSNIRDWQTNSHAKNIAFVLSQDTFILNVDYFNPTIQYGKPYLVKTSDWENLIEIPNIKTISNFGFTNDANGVLIDKDLIASDFTYNSADDTFVLTNLGTLNNFQFVNKNLVFGSVKENNLLISSKANKVWAATNSIQLAKTSSKLTDNLLNNVIVTKDEEIDYKNSFFADGPATLNVTNEALVNVEIKSASVNRILTPIRNQVTYEFSNFETYQVAANFFSDDTAYTLNYQVTIVSFLNKSLLEISGTNLVSYVGASKELLYDIKSLDKTGVFTIDQFDYSYLQYVQLLIFHDAENMVVENRHNLISVTEVKFSEANEDYFYGVKMVNLLNQISWIYLGFSNGTKPMIDFWDTERGQSLMNQALTHKWLERDLRNLNAQQIENLLITSRNWTSIEVQGKAIVISLVSVFAIALAAIVISIGYNIHLNEWIEIRQVEQNKILKNPLDL